MAVQQMWDDEPQARPGRRNRSDRQMCELQGQTQDRRGRPASAVERNRVVSRPEITTPEALTDDGTPEVALRPSRLDEFIGQDTVRENLQITIDAAKQRGDRSTTHSSLARRASARRHSPF